MRFSNLRWVSGRHLKVTAALAAALCTLPVLGAENQQVYCGLGPPPGSPEFDEYGLQQERQRQTLGYMLVCPEDLRRYAYLPLAKPVEDVLPLLALQPIPLSATPFTQRLDLLGGSADYWSEGKAAGFHRTYRSPSGRVIDLLEWDMSVSGGSIMADPKLQTERVKCAPAQLVVLQTPGGQAASILSWVQGRRYYELSIDANVRSSDEKALFDELAKSVPRILSTLKERATGRARRKL